MEHCTHQVVWSDDDGEFVATCSASPSLSHLDADRAVALAGIEALVRDVRLETGKS